MIEQVDVLGGDVGNAFELDEVLLVEVGGQLLLDVDRDEPADATS